MEIEVFSSTKIYVLCPAYVKTGGPEHMHQFVSSLKSFGYNADIVYVEIKEDSTQSLRHPEYDIYLDTHLVLEDIEDENDNVVIIPEGFSIAAFNFRNIRIALWFLGVHYFIVAANDIFKKLNRTAMTPEIAADLFFETLKGKVDYFLCHSYYTIDYLKKHGISNYMYLSDYINDIYFERTHNAIEKQDIVLYNPYKGAALTQKIIEKSVHLNWVPIKGLTTPQVKNLLLSSKVYVDFGDLLGKDHLPREAVACDCCIITGRLGSAGVYEDVPIPDEFKFYDKEENIEAIIEKIELCLNNYNEEYKKFEYYKEFVQAEKKIFMDGIKEIFVKRNDY